MTDPIAWMVVNSDGREAFVTADPKLANVNLGQRALPLYTGPVMDTCADVRSSSPTSGGGFVERELAVARGLASCRGDDERLDEADREIATLRCESVVLRQMSKDAPKHVVGGPFAWLVQTTMERNPPHGWAVHMFNGQNAKDAVPVYLKQEVDRLRIERDEHARWREDLAHQLSECERHRDAIGRALQRRENDLMLLRNAVEQMMAPLGYHGTISARDDRVQAVMDALAKIDAQEKRK